MILLASVLLALLMGFAVQRGGTCLVAALEEAVSKRRWSRFRALLETSLWVLGGFVLLRAFDRLPMVPMGYPLHWHAALGGALLGVGAFINGGCAFGVVARIGSGQWAWLATPLGFLAGFALAGRGLGTTSAMPVAIPDWLQQVPIGLVPMIIAALVARLGWLAWNRRNGSTAASIWSPHHATIVLGVAFLLLFVCVGAWAYTDILAELATGRFMELGLRGLLLPALFAGALLGGWSAGLWEHRWPTPWALVKCLCGGVLMGVGATLVPGGNDSLILFGMPLLWPNAWLAFACMCAVVVLTLWLARLGRG
ncbi:YeeE/YedE thiosulfate transporter family protein [Pseudomonas sp. TCU-HL1]|uniref:YeeE/YedE thiosulfate transporter family protein n=1 Tax=Pseudomonas sp. TCU-HL1 TaxID=1856685 RepID=UPI00083DF022|nr:YeeE/YedE thiosulfate transporter family protein [Pseudomonas sp. TCU-HL1]